MPRIYLSPSTQEGNYYVTGGTEEQYMNLVADAMVPYLLASGVKYTRNSPQMTAAQSVKQANEGYYDLYLALHSNGAPEGKYGTARGCEVYYYAASRSSTRAAQIFAVNLKKIYPLPHKVKKIATTSLGEVTKTRAPAILIELAYHDNVADATWIANNIGLIGQNLSLSTCQFLGVPLVYPVAPKTGTVTLSYGTLNIRSEPSVSSAILATVPNGSKITVIGQTGEWYAVRNGAIEGYALAAFIIL